MWFNMIIGKYGYWFNQFYGSCYVYFSFEYCCYCCYVFLYIKVFFVIDESLEVELLYELFVF